MAQTLTIQQLADAADLSRTQIDQWISRGHFKPKNPAETGKAREFTTNDAVVLGTLAELVRIGMTPAAASMHAHQIYAFKDTDALLVVSQGPTEIIPAKSKGRPTLFYDPANPTMRSDIVRPKDLAKIASDPNTRSMAVVNLTEVEKRVLHVIGQV